ncbi:peptide chain release factor 2 [candidate division WWE3 bacterium RIFOXYC1_FULL_40_10]|uniref:Peptide chain release factor 2 n=1 Tax=candidate division WWE3 bacterium RIFOXYA2_FULL_46_9 TaxID=1802636 RepID=A0A1F4VZ25_UNCKA|nr:MAG: peptide chain release factor 2 [candidate division WWE3 bacterium RIFOXYB1_FULL_40_22]OGC61901.1 MAG: peptide chain release factor 2 [candidate division WWE3 bacterium RIFOXYA1_FULL_40_11]OGC62268.1 MAG: peptide chain release factor 2 [candidate division WWE3 bacterium RIFOXYA2_FULL_46_9]OGC64372.1 MAG: peptide chain release factor 2 [candidate division WWE3 bacterium RIFOXYB2_FULL_41_6]OGC66284.1 MAG: peptide chain release factor 2 [candidate division WWE3 bacterium RIFOXYC1_FULL_40_10
MENSEPQQRLQHLKEAFFFKDKQEKIKQLQKELEDETTWKNWELGNKISQDVANLKRDIEEIELLELLLEDNNVEEFNREIKRLELKTFMSDPHDKGDALMSIHAGQGGTEAMDWVEMLYRMYLRYCEKKHWKVDEINQTPGDEAGLKSVTFEVVGPYVYGFLKHEAGVHRLVRQSPFNADNLRQTSFALIEIIPVVEESKEIEIKEEDLEWDFFRSGGKGGQNVNKVSTAVRLKHIPSGIIVESQEERYQGRNRDKALKVLKAKLFALEQQKIEEETQKAKGTFKTPGWGNQIRNYVLHPYKLIKDLRTNIEHVNPEMVLNGDLDEFIDAEVAQL